MIRRIAVFRSVSRLALACAFAAPSAYAGPPAARPHAPTTAPTPHAREHLKAAEEHFKAADYAAALSDFQAADADSPSPETARFLGLCQDELGDFRGAAVSYGRFLAHPPATLTDQVGPIVARLRELERMPGTVRIGVSADGAQITLDGMPERHAAPFEAHLAPGKHIVRASAPGFESLEREIDVAFATVQGLSLALEPAPAPEAPPPAPPVILPPPPPAPPPVRALAVEPPASSVSRRTVAYASAGVAVIGAGLATTFGVLALNNKSSYSSHATFDNADNGNNDAAYADGGAVLAVAAGVTSLVLFLTSDEPASTAGASRSPSVSFVASPFLAPNGAGAGAVLRF